MKKLCISLFLVCFCFSMLVYSYDGMIIFNDQKDHNIEVLTGYFDNLIEIRAMSSYMSYQIIEHGGSLYADLWFDGASVYAEYGSPDLPKYYKLIAVPEGAEFDIDIIRGKYHEFDLLAETGADFVYPVQLPVPKSGDHVPLFQLNGNIYESDHYYPEEAFIVHDEIRARGIRLLPISIFPVEYNPVSGRLRVFSDIKINIRLKGSDMLLTKKIHDRYLSDYHRIIKAGSLGLQELRSIAQARDLYYDYRGEGLLIISHDGFFDALYDFIEWKEIKGHRVTAVKVSDIPNGTTNTGIKAYIQNAYDNWAIPPSYIILVGDAQHIPTFTGPNAGTASDQLYVFLDGDDYFPDAGISRISVSDLSELNIYLNKILYYEQFGNSDLSWMTDAALISGQDSNWYHIGEGTLNYAVDNYLDPLGWDYDKLYRHTYDTTKPEVMASLNAGKMIANYTAHCSTTSWGFRTGQNITNTDVHTLSNQSMYFYAIGNCCQSARFDTVGECIGEAFIRTQNGAIAYWGASNNSYWYEDDILAKRSYDGFFEHNIQTLSANSDYSKIKLWQHYSGGGRSRMYMEYYVVLGDGTTFIPKTAPAEMLVNTSPFVPSGASSMSVSVTSGQDAVANALVSVYGPDINARGIARTNALGDAVLIFDNVLEEPGEFQLTVTHENHINNISFMIVGDISEGSVCFDRNTYTCNDEVEITLMDSDLENEGVHFVHVHSSTDPEGLDTALYETDVPGVFKGMIQLSFDLAVVHGDTITVTYFDEDTGNGSAYVTATADIDCIGPEIHNVYFEEIWGNSASIGFETDKDAVAYANYGTDPYSLQHVIDISSSYRKVHSGIVPGLQPGTDYFIEIVAYDWLGNESISGTYTFTTSMVISIGEGTVELDRAPLYCYYHDNRTQIIYDSSLLTGSEAIIDSLSMDITTVPVLTLNNFTIRMKHTNKNDHSAQTGFDSDGWHTVYQNNETITDTGWTTFHFNAPFVYNGTQNLMIDISFNNSSWQNPSGKARWTSVDNVAAIYAYSDSNHGDPLEWSGITNPTAYQTEHILNIRLGFVGEDFVMPPQDFTANSVSASEIQLSWQKNDNNDDVMIIYSLSGEFGGPADGTEYGTGSILDGGGIVIFKGSETLFEHSGLLEYTTYYYRAFSYTSDFSYSSDINSHAMTHSSPGSALPFIEDFDASTELPDGWMIIDNIGENQVWKIGTINGGVTGTTGNYAYLDSDAFGSGNTQNSDLISPMLDLTGYMNINLSFKHYYRHLSSSNASLSYSLDNGTTWQQIASWTATTSNPASFDQIISEVAGESQVRFKWSYQGTWAWYWSVDDIEVTGENIVSGHTVSLFAEPADIGIVLAGSGDYLAGEEVNISAFLSKGHEFLYWTGGFTELLNDSGSSSTYFTMPSHDVSFTAVFQQTAIERVSAAISLEHPSFTGIWKWTYLEDSSNMLNDDRSSWAWESLIPGFSAKKVLAADITGNGNLELIINVHDIGLISYNFISGFVSMIYSDCNDFSVARTNSGMSKQIIASRSSGLYIYNLRNNSESRLFSVPADTLMAFDLYRDGLDELIISFAGFNNTHIYSFSTESASVLVNAKPSQMVFGDLTGDGHDELICVFDGMGIYMFKYLPARKNDNKGNSIIDIIGDITENRVWVFDKNGIQVQRIAFASPSTHYQMATGNIAFGESDELIFALQDRTYYYSYEQGFGILAFAPMKTVITGRFAGQDKDDIIACLAYNGNIFLRRSDLSAWQLLINSGDSNAMATLK